MLPKTDYAAHAATIAQFAAKAAMGYFRGPLGTEFKQDTSPVTQADKGVETLVRTYLNEHFPDHGIFGEEHGIEGADKQRMWIIDPIDGTRSFLSGHPLFGFLLAHLNEGVPEIGVVGMPALDEVFLGVKGKGSTLNGETIKSSDQTHLDNAILYINEGEKIYADHPKVFDHLTRSGQTRRVSYDCYPHALLAAGHVDAVVDYDLQPYDYLPLSVVIHEAGGIITDWDGKPLTLNSDGRVLSAATTQIHEQLLTLVGDNL
jgi:inositol-phosphate phosphatase/L-galactose 1-phosphate phosphatase/histidinol-phosphatase